MNDIYYPKHYWTKRNKAGKKSNNRETVFPKFRKSIRHRSGRSNKKKNSTSPGKKAGVLEWVCKLQIHACVRDVFPLYFDTGVLGSPTGGFISCLCLFGSIRLSIRICIFLIYIVLNYNYLF